MQGLDVGKALAEEVDAASEGEEGMKPILHTPFLDHVYITTFIPATHEAFYIQQLPDGHRCCEKPW
jgi:hypothetical protein